MIEELDMASASDVINNESRGVLVDFWSPWCAPCRILRPHLNKIADERAATWRFIAINTDKHPDAAEALGVSALPTIAFFRAGEELDRFAGSALPSTVDAKLDELTTLRSV